MGFTEHLLLQGDRALARRDADALAAVARRLSRRVGDPLRDQLLALAVLCPTRLELVALRWPTLRDQVLARVATAGT